MRSTGLCLCFLFACLHVFLPCYIYELAVIQSHTQHSRAGPAGQSEAHRADVQNSDMI